MEESENPDGYSDPSGPLTDRFFELTDDYRMYIRITNPSEFIRLFVDEYPDT